ncbi:DUF397 domain-containing protein [Nonomuraea sp. NPDC050643]|uniref:DUF397 domain-containing protein n=1 Tax=Nonomuraea sp. NPDC050643 TaxID=3155660 RepID=UPI0033DC0922
MYADASATAWRKSTFCNGASTCVEVSPLPDGGVALRDSKDPDSPILVFGPSEWAAFVAGVRDGEFDLGTLQSLAVAPSVEGRMRGAEAVLATSGAAQVSR